MKQKLQPCLIVFILFLNTTSNFVPKPSADEVKALETRLKNGKIPMLAGRNKPSSGQWKPVVHFYETRNFRPVWIARGVRQPQAGELIKGLEQAPAHGLRAEDYSSRPLEDPIEDELQLTWLLFKLGYDVASKDADLEKIITRAIDEKTLPAIVDQLAPKLPEYRSLQQALERFPDAARRIALNMDRLRHLPSDPGARYIRVNIPEYSLSVVENGAPVLTMRVVVGKEQTPTPTFSAEMSHLVFSPYWNIPESILTKETLPKVFEDADYIRQQNIEVIRVSSGKTEIVDPSEIDWSKITADSGIRFRQRPGAGNSLGLVKFMFPNRHNVYLHDTPADSLFDRAERDFSHGCVRVEKPVDLAMYLLRDQPQWTREKIEAAMHSGIERTVNLKEPLPVHIIYLSAFVGPDGLLNFRKDIYGRDKDDGTPKRERWLS